jgi:hypothetical protein
MAVPLAASPSQQKRHGLVDVVAEAVKLARTLLYSQYLSAPSFPGI